MPSDPATPLSPRPTPRPLDAARVVADRLAAEAWAAVDALVRRLVGAHSPSRLLPAGTDPEDLLQAILAEVLTTLAGFAAEPCGSLARWVNAILARKARAFWRLGQRSAADAGHAAYLNHLATYDPGDPSSDEPKIRAQAAAIEARARRARQTLDARDLRVLTLREDHGLSARAIGMALGGMPEATARAILLRAGRRRARCLRATSSGQPVRGAHDGRRATA